MSLSSYRWKLGGTSGPLALSEPPKLWLSSEPHLSEEGLEVPSVFFSPREKARWSECLQKPPLRGLCQETARSTSGHCSADFLGSVVSRLWDVSPASQKIPS